MELLERDSVVLWLDGHKRKYYGRSSSSGVHRLTFRGVTKTDLSLHHLSAWWLYEEVDQHCDAAELRVVLTESRRSTFYVRFSSVAVHTTRDPKVRPSPTTPSSRKST